MMEKNITVAHFSPGGSTKEVSELFASALDGSTRYIDLMKTPLDETEVFGENDLLIVAMPVFAGRTPSVCGAMLRKLRGKGASAVAIAVYGNRDFDDALVEIADLLQEGGFRVVGAAAFIARHSIFPTVAEGRPDAKDKDEITRFAKACLENAEKPYIDLTIPGNHPYKEPGAMPLRPTGKKSSCTGCNACVEICPTQAISKAAPTKTDKAKCITCMACVYHCSVGSRGLHTPLYKIANGQFKKQCAERKDPTVVV